MQQAIVTGEPPACGWDNYLRGFWLEDLTAAALARAAAAVGVSAEIKVGLCCTRDDAELELDVVGLVGHRPLLISCTAGTDGRVAKMKAYEAERRAWQLAGPVARPALAAPLGPRSHPREETIEAIFDEPLELHRSTDLEVFNRAVIRSWASTDGDDAPATLTSWLRAGLGAT